MARYIGQEIQEKGRFNTPFLFWTYLRASLEEFPLALKVFVLHDEQGEYREIDGRQMPIGVHSDVQARRNLILIRENQEELLEFGLKAMQRIEAKMEEEESGQLIPTIPDLDSPTQLLSRARERLILALGVQDLFSCLIYPEQRAHLFYGSIYYQSSAAISHFYLEGGKISFPSLSLASFLGGVEAARIRECQICFVYFWAGRKDQRCCSSQCANTHRQQRYRERYLESYKQQRYRKFEEEAKR